MIYTKIKSKDLGIETKIVIDPKKLFCSCSECKKEIALNINYLEFMSKESGFISLFDTNTLCDKCSLELLKMEEYKNDK